MDEVVGSIYVLWDIFQRFWLREVNFNQLYIILKHFGKTKTLFVSNTANHL